MDQLLLPPVRKVDGTVDLPGSKSLSNRVLLLAAFARGKTEVHNLLESDDTKHMLDSLKNLGTDLVLSDDGTRCIVTGLGGPFPASNADLYLGASGTDIRLLCSAVCLGNGMFSLTGEPRMFERPIGDLVDPLTELGAEFQYLKDDGYPPLRVKASGLKGKKVSVRGNISSQYLTSLLVSSPMMRERFVIEVEGELVSKPYIDMTVEMIRRFGVEVVNYQYQSFEVPKSDGYESPGRALVEGDASSATYFLSAAAIKGGTVRVNGVGRDSVQGDVEHAAVLEKMGAKVSWGQDWIEVSGAPLHGIDVDLNHMPDAAMTVATTALFAKGKTVIRNIYNWRLKETDRLSAMSTELKKVGAEVIEGEDYLEIVPPDKISSASIDTYNDHRMAMCFSLASLGESEIIINDPGCVSKTFPDYFSKFQDIVKII